MASTTDASTSLSTQTQNEFWSIVLFTTSIAVAIVGSLSWLVYKYLKTPSDLRRVVRIQSSVDAARLIENFRWQIQILIHLPKPWKSWKSMKPHVWENTVSLLSLLIFVLAAILLFTGFGFAYNQRANAGELFSGGMISFTLSSSLFVIARQWIYYQEKRRVGGVTAIDAGFIPRDTPSNLSTPSLSMTANSEVPTSRAANAQFNPPPVKQKPEKARRATSIQSSLTLNVDSRTTYTFYSFQWSFRNVLQIMVVIVEFLQLVSFPIRDLMHNPVLIEASTGQSFVMWFESIFQVIALFPNQFSETLLRELQFWTFFAFILAGAVVAIIFAITKYKFQKNWPSHWIFFFVPICVSTL
jgi:hypothetical protein